MLGAQGVGGLRGPSRVQLHGHTNWGGLCQEALVSQTLNGAEFQKGTSSKVAGSCPAIVRLYRHQITALVRVAVREAQLQLTRAANGPQGVWRAARCVAE